MKRRTFVVCAGLVLAGLAAAAITTRAGHAQQSRIPRIGFLGAADPAVAAPWIAAFDARLRELGWVDGRTATIEYRWAGAQTSRYAEIAADFAARKVDIIVTWASAPVLAAKQATSVIPIVFAAQMDPVGAGVVANMARPGGNVTGLSIQQTDTAGKRLELLRECVPGMRRLAIMVNSGAPGAMIETREIGAGARAAGLDIVVREIASADDIGPALQSFAGQADALYVATDPLVFANRSRINALAQDARLATIYGSREYVEAGALISYGPNFPDLFRRAAEYVDKILRGARPADIPIEQPTKFDLVINLKTAKALGITISPALLLRADEVIE